MKFLSIYTAALLAISINGAHVAQTTLSDPPQADQIDAREDNITSTMRKELLEDDPKRWGASRVEYIEKDLFSPETVKDMLESYTLMLQSFAVRSNFQLRDAKAASRNLTSHIDMFRDWWTRQRWESIPEDSLWFDGTLAEGLINTVDDIANRHGPNMYNMGRHLNLGGAATRPGQGEDHTYTLLKEDAESVTALLSATVKGQEEMASRIEKMVTTLVARARRFAVNIEEFQKTLVYSIQRSSSWNAEDGGVLKSDSTKAGMGGILSQVGESIFPSSRAAASKRLLIDESDLDAKFLSLYARYALNFLEDDAQDTNGTAVRQTISGTYENFFNGLEMTVKVAQSATTVMASTKTTLEGQMGNGANAFYRWPMRVIDSMANTIKKVNFIQRFAQPLIEDGDQLVSDMDKELARRVNETMALQARSRGLEPQDDGQPPAAGKQIIIVDPATGIPSTVQYFYSYSVRSPWKFVDQIRAAADVLEYTWSTIAQCEEELAYLNLCEAIDIAPAERKKALSSRFRRPQSLADEEAPPCDSFSNPWIMNHVCISNENEHAAQAE